jgi:hypothetical protein
MKNDLACTQQRIQRGTNHCARLTSVADTPTGIFKFRLASRLVLGSDNKMSRGGERVGFTFFVRGSKGGSRLAGLSVGFTYGVRE